MSGQRARSNLVNVDGADATDNGVNGVRSTVSQKLCRSFNHHQQLRARVRPRLGRVEHYYPFRLE